MKTVQQEKNKYNKIRADRYAYKNRMAVHGQILSRYNYGCPVLIAINKFTQFSWY